MGAARKLAPALARPVAITYFNCPIVAPALAAEHEKITHAKTINGAILAAVRRVLFRDYRWAIIHDEHGHQRVTVSRRGGQVSCWGPGVHF